MNFKLPDHADRRKASADSKRALLAKIKKSQTEAKPTPKDEGKRAK